MMNSKTVYPSDLYSQFELALQELCFERNISVPAIGWNNSVNELYNYYILHWSRIYHAEWNGSLHQRFTLHAAEILWKIGNVKTEFDENITLVDDFIESKLSRFFVTLTFPSPNYCWDCDTIHGVSTAIFIPRDPKEDWELRQMLKCYTGNYLVGTKEECIEKVESTLKEHVLDSETYGKSYKHRVNQFVSDLKNVKFKVPTSLPKH